MIHYIYKTTNLINGKFYIGKRSTSLYDNWYDDPYIGSGKLLKAAIKKYGKQSFIKNIFCYADNRKDNANNEVLFVADQWKLKECYNLRPGGEGGSVKGVLTYTHTEEAKQKISKTKTGKHHSEKTKRIHSKPVLQYSKDGKFIAEYYGLGEAYRQTGVRQTCISSACIGKRQKTAGGFVWRYKE